MLTIRDAVPSDLRAFAAGAISRQHGRAFSMQLGAQAWTLTRDGAPIAAAGFWPAEGYREAWFMVRPELRAKSVMPRAVAMIAERLAALYDPDLPTMAAVQADNRGGRAIAGRLGFIDAGEHPLYPGARMFVLTPPAAR